MDFEQRQKYRLIQKLSERLKRWKMRSLAKSMTQRFLGRREREKHSSSDDD